MRNLIIVACWIMVIGTGAFLRFEQLSKRPFHADEATGARITAARMESGDYRFDPLHYHGPTLSRFTIPLCQLHNERNWREMTKKSPRILTATAGTLLILVPLLWRRRYGDGVMLLSAALLATSPLLVYYSRMFIHESLLVLFGMLALTTAIQFWRFGVPGIFIGLMFATKETFAISIIAWCGAALFIALENRRQIDRAWLISYWQQYRAPVAASLFSATLVAGYFYTDGFRQPQGAVDALRTFLIYETVEGHHKPFSYYCHLLIVPFQSGHIWWFGTPVFILALLGYVSSFRKNAHQCHIIRFVAYAAAGHFLIYSLIAYKTPWLACLPWAHVCLLAGFSIAGFSSQRFTLKAMLCLLVSISIFSQIQQSRMANSRFASDERNPFAYVPTRNEIESLEPWLKQVEQISPQGTLEPIAVIGTDYWPLPWYLRHFKQVGYWNAPFAELTQLALVFVMPEKEDEVARQLQETHTALPRGLRAGVPVVLWMRNDIWNAWMKSSN